jgi:hypothetical protein
MYLNQILIVDKTSLKRLCYLNLQDFLENRLKAVALYKDRLLVEHHRLAQIIKLILFHHPHAIGNPHALLLNINHPRSVATLISALVAIVGALPSDLKIQELDTKINYNLFYIITNLPERACL